MNHPSDNPETSCPVCHGEGELSAEEKRAVEDTRAQLTTQSAALTQALERAERAERRVRAWDWLAAWDITITESGSDYVLTVFDESEFKGESRAHVPSDAAVELASKLGLLDSASQVKP